MFENKYNKNNNEVNDEHLNEYSNPNFNTEGYIINDGKLHYETVLEDDEPLIKKILIYISYAIIFTTLLALCIFLYQVKVVLDDPSVPNNVYLLNENLGGTNYKNLEKTVSTIAKRIANRPIYLNINENKMVIIPEKDIDFKIDVGLICSMAQKIGNEGNLFQRVKQKLRLKAGRSKVQLPCKYYFNKTKLENLALSIAERFSTSPKSSVIIELDNGYKKIQRDVIGVKLYPEEIYRQIKHELSNLSSPNLSEIALNYEMIKPQITLYDKLIQLNSNDLISQFETNYIIENLSIKQNVENLAKALDGLILKPLEVFSFNKFFGAVKYKNEQDAIIFNSNKLGFFPDVSGGCGVFSSALYNAILVTKVEILERHNHLNCDANYIYCPIGRDAQVIFNNKDLKFILPKNFSPLIFLCEAKNGKLKIEIYGKKVPNETIQIETIEKNVINPPEKIVKDYSLKKDEKRIEQEGIVGYEVKTAKNVIVGGEKNYQTIISTDVYSPIPKIIRVGDESEE